MGLRLKFNLVLLVVFVAGLGVTGYVSYELLHQNARDEVLRNAGVMMEASLSMRNYTVSQVRPNLAVDPDKFLPQSVPAFGATEIMSLLQHSTLDHQLNPAFLENASPRSIERKVEAFRPEVVHFICHGMIDAQTNAGKLILQPDPPGTNKHFGGDQITQWLRASSPQIVVLSACDSGVASGAALGPQIISPLAAELVANGIPIVVGMSGRVSDQACRLFTRRFAQALFSGETLVAAAAKGRRAAFAQGAAAPDYPDWAFPTIYLSAKVDSQYAPACKNAGPDIKERLRLYSLPDPKKTPVFCGRQDFFESYRELLDSTSMNNVVAASVADNAKGYGRTRLLQQLTLQAIVDGNVPCPILTNGTTWKAPKNEFQVARLINQATKIARQSLDLPTGEDTPLELLETYKNGYLPLHDLPQPLAKDIRRTTVRKQGDAPVVMPSTICVAIALQFADLMKSAREKHPDLIKPTSRAILLLDDADEYLNLLLNIADEKTLGTSGFGGPERVPIVMAFSGSTTARDVVAPNSPRVGWNIMELLPFCRAANRREDMLAYARVLMNPFDKTILTGISDKAWFMDYGADAASVSECETLYSNVLTGKPADLSSIPFYLLAKLASVKKFALPATDEEALKALGKL
jgi:hypothetical protein